MGNAKSKSSNKESTAKTSSQAQSGAQTAAAVKSNSSGTKASQAKTSNTKASNDGSKKRSENTRKEPSGKNSRAKSVEDAGADIAESAKVEPPPEVAEPEATMSPEEVEQARKSYLLKRFWISARGFWGKRGDRIVWIASIGLFLLIVFSVIVQYGINVWNREIFDAIEKRNSATVLWLSVVFFPLAFTMLRSELPKFTPEWGSSDAGAHG